MLDDPQDCIGAALKKLHASWNSSDTAQLDAARLELIAQKPLLRAYLNAEAQDQLVAGDLTAAETWSTVAQRAIEAAPSLVFSYPVEGFSRYADTVAILEESSRKELAHQFVNYMLRAEVASAIAAHTKTATANRAAEAILPKEIRENPALYPPPDILARGEWSEDVPAATQRLRDRIWTQVKSA
jgi:spermidine/putrescine-binding protein